MNSNPKSQFTQNYSKAPRSSENEILNAKEVNTVGEPRQKCMKPGEEKKSSSSKEITEETEPPRFLDVGYNRHKVPKNVDKSKVMATVTLSARKKALNEYLVMLLNLRKSELESNENLHQTMLFLCCACSMRFKTYRELRNHIERTTSRLLWRCAICWLSFETRNICQVVYHAPEYHINELGNFPEKIPIELIDAASVGEPVKMIEVCPECRQAVGSVITHLWYSRQKDPAYHCPHCNAFFTRNVCRYNLHIRMHKNSPPFRCPDCAKLFDNCTSLLLHLNKICRHVQLTGRYKCPVCHLIFSTELRLKNHILTAHNPVKYKCNICPCEINITSEKNMHYSEKHSNQLTTAELRRAKSYILSHICALCGESGLKGYSYERHISKHFSSSLTFKICTFQCNCSFITNYRATYLRHKSTPCITNYFSSLKNSSALLKLCMKCLDLKYFNGSDPFLCECCEYQEKYWKRIFYLCLLCKKRITYAMEHVMIHFQNEHKTIDLEDAYKRVMKLPCIDIDIKENDLEIVKNNINTAFDKDSSQKLSVLDINVEGNVKINENDRLTVSHSHKCNKCSECFSDKNLLRSHYLSAHRHNPNHIPCLECGDSFKNINSLSIHLRTHGINNAEVYLKRYGISVKQELNDKLNANDLLCPVCDKAFSSGAKKTQHMRSHGMLFLKQIKEM